MTIGLLLSFLIRLGVFFVLADVCIIARLKVKRHKSLMYRDFISPWDWRHIRLENSKLMMYNGTWGLKNMLIMCYVDKKSCSEKLFNHTQAIKITENKIYEQNCSMLQMLAHSVRRGFRKLSVFCVWITKFLKINNFRNT